MRRLRDQLVLRDEVGLCHPHDLFFDKSFHLSDCYHFIDKIKMERSSLLSNKPEPLLVGRTSMLVKPSQPLYSTDSELDQAEEEIRRSLSKEELEQYEKF